MDRETLGRSSGIQPGRVVGLAGITCDALECMTIGEGLGVRSGRPGAKRDQTTGDFI
jgi:hypothetical protein